MIVAGASRIAVPARRLLLISSEIARDGTALPEYDAFRRQISSALDDFSEEASKLGYSARDVEDAKFALVALIDEAVQHSSWQHRDSWVLTPIQWELFRDRDAGESFFRRLESCRKSRDILEVFHLCLALGFRGRYRRDDPDLARLLAGLGEDFGRDAPEALSPEPELVQSREARPRDRLRAFAGAAVIALFAACLIGVWFAIDLRSASTGTMAAIMSGD